MLTNIVLPHMTTMERFRKRWPVAAERSEVRLTAANS